MKIVNINKTLVIDYISIHQGFETTYKAVVSANPYSKNDFKIEKIFQYTHDGMGISFNNKEGLPKKYDAIYEYRYRGSEKSIRESFTGIEKKEFRHQNQLLRNIFKQLGEMWKEFIR